MRRRKVEDILITSITSLTISTTKRIQKMNMELTPALAPCKFTLTRLLPKLLLLPKLMPKLLNNLKPKLRLTVQRLSMLKSSRDSRIVPNPLSRDRE